MLGQHHRNWLGTEDTWIEYKFYHQVPLSERESKLYVRKDLLFNRAFNRTLNYLDCGIVQ